MKARHGFQTSSPSPVPTWLVAVACMSWLACDPEQASSRSGSVNVGEEPLPRIGDVAPKTYRLVQYNGKSLPVDQGPVPRRCPPVATTPPCDPANQPVCHLLMTEGTLSLDAERHRYTHFYIVRNSCGARVLNLSDSTGRYDVNGRSLIFRTDGREPYAYLGELDGDAVVIDRQKSVLRFERSATPAAGLMAGEFNLLGQRIENLPTSDPAASNPTICPRVVNSGVLTLEPLDGMFPHTGRFRLAHQLTDSCTGHSTVGRDESGTYEQVVNTLVFTAYLAPNVVHPFQGSIKGPDIDLHIGADNDLLFRR